MTGHYKPNGPDHALSSDSVHRVTQYQAAGTAHFAPPAQAQTMSSPARLIR